LVDLDGTGRFFVAFRFFPVFDFGAESFLTSESEAESILISSDKVGTGNAFAFFDIGASLSGFFAEEFGVVGFFCGFFSKNDAVVEEVFGVFLFEPARFFDADFGAGCGKLSESSEMSIMSGDVVVVVGLGFFLVFDFGAESFLTLELEAESILLESEESSTGGGVGSCLGRCLVADPIGIFAFELGRFGVAIIFGNAGFLVLFDESFSLVRMLTKAL
jgi:hypothetical protein